MNKEIKIKLEKLVLPSLIASALSISSFSFADPRNVDRSWYIGGSLGQSSLEPDASNTGWAITDKGDFSKKIYVGKNFNDHVGIEAFWTGLGAAGVTSTTGGGEGKIDYKGYGANVVYNLPFRFGDFKPFAKLGIAKFKTTDKAAATSRQMNKTAVLAGIGVDYEISDQLNIRTEYDYYDKDVQDLNVGLKWSPGYQSHRHTRVQAVKVAAPPKVVYQPTKPKVVYVPKKVYVKTPPVKPKYQVIRRNLAGGSNFDTASADLTYLGENILNRLVDDINRMKIEVKSILLTGHTDSVGSHQSNQILSINRANSVAAYLSSRGIPRNLINTVGKGETQPIADNRTVYGKAKNRRVEITINGTSRKVVSR